MYNTPLIAVTSEAIEIQTFAFVQQIGGLSRPPVVKSIIMYTTKSHIDTE